MHTNPQKWLKTLQCVTLQNNTTRRRTNIFLYAASSFQMQTQKQIVLSGSICCESFHKTGALTVCTVMVKVAFSKDCTLVPCFQVIFSEKWHSSVEHGWHVIIMWQTAPRYQLLAVIYASMNNQVLLGISICQWNKTDRQEVLYAKRPAATCQQPTVIHLIKRVAKNQPLFDLCVTHGVVDYEKARKRKLQGVKTEMNLSKQVVILKTFCY